MPFQRLCAAFLLATLGAPLALARGPADDAMAALNHSARARYAEARWRVVESRPALFVRFDRMELHVPGKAKPIRSRRRMPRSVHDQKTVGHVLALGLYPALRDCAPGDPLDETRAAGLLDLSRNVAVVRRHLGRWFKDKAVRARQERLLAAAQSFLDDTRRSRKCPAKGAVDAFLRAHRGDIARNLAASAHGYLSHIEAVARELIGKLSPEQQQRMVVVVTGSPAPRDQNAAVQVIARLIGERGEGERIIYVENKWTAADALPIIGAHDLDRSMGAVFFDDETRMFRDLLADEAQKYLERQRVRAIPTAQRP